jgi:hypothetical protein
MLSESVETRRPRSFPNASRICTLLTVTSVSHAATGSESAAEPDDGRELEWTVQVTVNIG